MSGKINHTYGSKCADVKILHIFCMLTLINDISFISNSIFMNNVSIVIEAPQYHTLCSVTSLSAMSNLVQFIFWVEIIHLVRI